MVSLSPTPALNSMTQRPADATPRDQQAVLPEEPQNRLERYMGGSDFQLRKRGGVNRCGRAVVVHDPIKLKIVRFELASE